MSRKTKKELILQIFEAEGFRELTPEAIKVINLKLVEAYGTGGMTSAAYMAEILTAASKAVYYSEELNIPNEIDLYSFPALNFDTLANAEASLIKIDSLFRGFQLAQDSEAIFRCQDFVKRAKIRAQLIASNDKISIEKREVKSEISFWFEIWLNTPDIFKDWLALRVASKDFQNKFSIKSSE